MLNEKRAHELFEQAIGLPQSERDSFLEISCQGDEELISHLRELLQLAPETDETSELDASGIKDGIEAPEDLCGSVIAGRYRLEKVIGEGGFGVVYLANQLKPVRRQVAVKIIKLGMDSRAIVSRFEAERQSLALMDHSGIARILDGGTTSGPLEWSRLDTDGDGVISRDEWIAAMQAIDRDDDGEITRAEWQAAANRGRPYFVMEYVEGIPINEHCDQNNLDIKERMTLFQQLCEAVQHAHSKGIIHRDLKPSNVLVTTDTESPRVIVIDFGIAKALEAKLEDATFFTEAGQFIGTPEYMSPEQFKPGELDIDIRSDIYSLGVLLYELLSGQLPYGRDELRRGGLPGIQHMIQDTDPPRPSTRYQRLQSSSTNTYSSIAEARSVSPTALTRRLRGDLDWIVMKCLEKDRDMRYETASSLSTDLACYLSDQPVAAGPPSRRYRTAKFIRRNRRMVATTVVMLAIFLPLSAFGIFMALQASFDSATRQGAQKFVFGILDELQSAATKDGNNENIITLISIAESQMDAFQNVPQAMFDAQSRLGSVYGFIKQPEKSLSIHRANLELANSIPDARRGAMAAGQVAIALYQNAEYEEAFSMANLAIEKLNRHQPNNYKPVISLLLGQIYNYQTRNGMTKQAEETLARRAALSSYEESSAEPHELTAFLAYQEKMGILFDQEKDEESEALARQYLEKFFEQYGPEHHAYLSCQHDLALAISFQDRFEEAESIARATYESALDNLHPHHLITLSSLSLLIDSLNHQEKWKESLSLSKQLHQMLVESNAKSRSIINALIDYCYALENNGQYEEAEKHRREILEHAATDTKGKPDLPTLRYMNQLAYNLRKQSKYDESESLHRETARLHQDVLGLDHPNTIHSFKMLTYLLLLDKADLLIAESKLDEAESCYREVIEIRNTVLGQEDELSLSAHIHLINFMLDQKRFQDAESEALKSLVMHEQVLGADHEDTQTARSRLVQIYEGLNLPEKANTYRESVQP